jgi:hypothetical protein
MKSDKTTIRARVEEVLQIRLRGAQHADIVRHAEEQGWSVGERQLRSYIAQSDEILEETLEKDRQRLLNRHLAQRQTLYAYAFAAADYATARAILKDEAELLNLYPAKRTELTGANGGPLQTEVTMNDDQLQNAIAGIIGSHEAMGQASSGTDSGQEADSDGFTLE